MKHHTPGYELPLPKATEIVPGQSDEELEVFLGARRWLDRDVAGSAKIVQLNSPSAARLVYAGILGRSAPKQEDYDDAGQYRCDHDAWRAACTERQRELLEEAAEHARERRRREAREAYAEQVGGSVRAYQRDPTEEQRKEAAKKRHRRFREKMSPDDRRKYERERKAAQRAAKRERVAAEKIAEVSEVVDLSGSSKRSKMEKPSLQPSMSTSLDHLIDDLDSNPTRQLTPLELDLIAQLED